MHHFFFLKKSFPSFLFVLFASCLFISCSKTGNMTTVPPDTNPVLPDLSTKINASVSGFVTNDVDMPVIGATVTFGASSLITDQFGFFEFQNILVTQNAAVITVTKSGFFAGIKTFVAEANKATFFRVKLIPKAIIGTINGSSGGTVTMASGLSISFPAMSTANANTGAAYSGVITVKAAYINPMATDLSSVMPGDLRGLAEDGSMKVLTTFGMATVELSGSAGELLQIAAGKKATMSVTIPSAQSAIAPASIPLWYFNETNGLWKQEGSAIKNGNTYTGDVSHFSYWNYDLPGNFVQFNCTIVSSTSVPIPFALVRISVIGGGYRDGYSNANGYASGLVPSNATLKLEVFDNSNCSNAIYVQNFTTTNVTASLGNINLPASSRIATLTGTVKNCNNINVINGKIIINNGTNLISYPLNNGMYSFNKLVCSFPSTVSLIGEDINASQQSQATSYNILATGMNNVPDITACAVAAQQYFNYTDNGNNVSYSSPIDTFGYWVAGTSSTDVYANRNPFIAAQSSGITYAYGNINTTVGSVMAVSSFSSMYTTGFTPLISGSVTFTEYGSIGQFVSGNISVVKTDAQTSVVHNITGNFRVRRTN